jgi:HEAT repeat protein
VEQSVTRSLSHEKGDPQKSLASLARLLNGTSAERILERFPAERRDELRQLKPTQLAAEYIEDTALQLAGTKFQAGGESSRAAIEEDVVTVLSRSLEATHLADRLAAKLAKFIQDFAIPPHVQEKINEELQWTTYDVNKRFAKLMALPRYSNLEYRRLLELGRELAGQRDKDRAAALMNHYLEFLDPGESPVESSDLGRAPEIIQTLAFAYPGFVAKTSARLEQLLGRENVSEFVHFQAANALSVLGQCAVDREEFIEAAALGLVLEKSRNLNPEKHARCCGASLAALVSPYAVEQIVESHVQKRDSASAKTNATLLRFATPGSIGVVMDRLVSEADARNRLSLVRLASQLGKGSIEVAVRYLADERWYVIRNMCVVLAELNDPDLIEHLMPALRHSDARVQQAALKALLKARGVKTAQILADSLSTFSPHVLDEALDQLMYMKSPNTVPALEAFVAAGQTNLVRTTKAIQVLGAIPDVAGVYALGRLFRIEELDAKVRQAALASISSQRSAVATQLLQELSTSWGPLAEEVKKELEKRQFKKS